jgi:hypothetical protein
MGARGSAARGVGRSSKDWRLADAGPREETIVYEQDLRHVYALVGGAASWARDYQGEVTFRQDPSGGTEVRWRASFVPTIPGTGWLVSAAMRAMVWFFAMRLARAAEVEWPRFSGRG